MNKEVINKKIFILITSIINVLLISNALPSIINVLLFSVIGMMCIKYNELYFFMILPTYLMDKFGGVTPLQILFIFVIISLTLYLRKNSIKGFKVPFLIKNLFIILIWFFICGVMNSDIRSQIELCKTLIMIIILYILSKSTNFNINLSSKLYFLSYLYIFPSIKFIGGNEKYMGRLAISRFDPNLLALYCSAGSIAFFLIAYIFFEKKNKYAKSLICLFLSISLFIMMWKTESRGALISFIITFILLIIYLIGCMFRNIKFLKKNKFYKSYFIFMVLLIVILPILTINKDYLIDNIKNSRLVQMSDDGVGSRGILLERYLDMFKENLSATVIGLPTYRMIEIIGHGTHNSFIDAFILGGIIGGSYYLIILINIFYKILKLYSRNKNVHLIIIFFMGISMVINSASLSIIGEKVLWVGFLLAFINQDIVDIKER